MIPAVQSYLAMRRATGFVLKCQGSLLESFARYSDSKRKRCICAQTAINWAATTKSLAARARRLGEVIRFARYMRAEDQRHEVPPPVFGSDSRPRRRPYIFSEDDIQRLIQAASKLGRRNSFRGDTYNTFFSLLVCTGLRLSEAIRLRFEDITPDGLLVRCSKFRKSRLVPLHESARAGLETYLRQRLPFAPLDDHLFVSLSKRPLLAESVQTAFNTVVKEIGLKKGPGLPRLTVHSLRHTFAVRSLQNCPDNRDRIAKHMMALSTYLGHSRVADTYWYLEATPELMKDISKKVERFVEAGGGL